MSNNFTVKAYGQSLSTTVKAKEPIIIGGNWLDMADAVITETLFGDTVKFKIFTKNIPDDTVLKLTLYDYDIIFDDRLAIYDVIVKSDIAELEIVIDKSWATNIKQEGDNVIELYFDINTTVNDLKIQTYLPVKANAYLKVKAKIIVETIECIMELHEGSDNTGTGTPNGVSGIQKGFIYPKLYKFKVSKFTEDSIVTRLTKKNVIWEYSYTTEAGDLISVSRKTLQGDNFSLKIDKLEMCGRDIKILAYIENKEKEGKLEIFCHHRFRHFDRATFLQQITDRVGRPFLINQGSTSLCGIACIFYLLAHKDSGGFAKLAEELHRTGKTTYNKYTIKPTLHRMYDANPADASHPSMPAADWVVMASTRSKESLFDYVGKQGQDASAINWPWLMTRLGRSLVGYKDIEFDLYKIRKSYIQDMLGSTEKLRILNEDINNDFLNGYKIILMIDAGMITNDSTATVADFNEYHWIVYEGNLTMIDSTRTPTTNYDDVHTISFDCFTWGANPITSRTSTGIRMEVFRNNYYGYIKLK